jgi:hypothetical protein
MARGHSWQSADGDVCPSRRSHTRVALDKVLTIERMPVRRFGNALLIYCCSQRLSSQKSHFFGVQLVFLSPLWPSAD